MLLSGDMRPTHHQISEKKSKWLLKRMFSRPR